MSLRRGDRSVVHRDINGGASPLLHRNRLSPRRLRLRRLLFLFVFVRRTGSVSERIHDVHHRQVKGSQEHQALSQNENDAAANSAEYQHQRLGNETAHHTAALDLQPLGPKSLYPLQTHGEFPLVEEKVQNRAHDQRGQKGAPQPQPYGPPPMEGQYVTGHRQHGRRQPEAVTEESLEQAAKEVNEEGLDVEITEGGKEGQQQTDHCPHLPADGLGLRRGRRPAAPAPLPGRGAACPLSGRGGSALPSRVLLLCRGHGIILSGAGGRGSAAAAL